MAAKAQTTFLENDEIHAGNVPIYLVEIPKPLNSESIYSHAALLTYQDDEFDWDDQAEAPTATLHDLNNSNSGNNISDLANLSLSQRFAGIGMSWKSYGTGLADASTEASNTQLYAFQNVDIPMIPMDDVKFTDYGFSEQAALVYDVYPPSFRMVNGEYVIGPNGKPLPSPNSINLGDYYIDPQKATDSIDSGGGYHLRKVDITGSTNFDPNSGEQLSYGRFPYFPDHVTIHPTGHVIGISQQYSKVMILNLSENGAADDALPVARDYAGLAQDANRQGLLFRPIAVSCSYDGTILILDSYTNEQTQDSYTRIQAFDLLGRPVSTFFDDDENPTPFLELPTDNVTYLDMVAVGNKKMTYMYVLYYEGDGSDVQDYKVAIYQYGDQPPATNPLVTTSGVPAARIQVDMWHTLYTLNYEMITDGEGNPSGPSGTNVGPNGRTVPSVSSWEPPLPANSDDTE